MSAHNHKVHFYLGVLELALGDTPASSATDLILLIAPNEQAAKLVLEGHSRALADGTHGIAVPALKVDPISYDVYAKLAAHLVTLSIFKGADGTPWKRELRVAVEGERRTVARSWWTARELQQVVALMAVARHEKMTEVRQHMNVDWLDRTTLVADEAMGAHKAEVLVRPFDNKLAFACQRDAIEAGGDCAEVRSVWISFSDLARLFEPGAGPVEA